MDLLADLRPWLRYDSQESFFADWAAELTDRPGNVLARRDHRVLAAADPKQGQQPLSLDHLGAASYLDGTRVDREDYLDASGRDYVAQARAMHARPGYANRIHAHAVTGADGVQWLQYWFFHYYNNKSFLGLGLHEGDWEMIQIRVTRGQPDAVTFAQHNSAERRDWHEIETRDGAPVVYLALGSHASHPHKGKYEAPVVPDYNDARGPLVRPELEILDDDFPSWAGWPGYWGSTRARTLVESPSPRGPSQHAQWNDPAGFHAHAKTAKEVRAAAQASRELPEPPAPIIEVQRSEDGAQAVVEYTFPAVGPGQPPPASILLTVDSPDDALPPATSTFPVDSARGGTAEHPLPIGPGRWTVTAGAASEDGRLGPTTTAVLEPATAGGVR